MAKTAKEHSVPNLEGQYARRGKKAAKEARRTARSADGFAMAALLVAIALMGVMMSVAMPVWRQQNQREKESELIFRAGQYTRAIELFKRRYANAYPPNLDVLVQQKYLRKKYKDPITGGDFRLLSPLEMQATPAVSKTPGLGTGGAGSQPAQIPTPRLPGRDPATVKEGGTGQIAGVASRSTAKSIRIYKNRQQYNLWIVTAEDVFLRPAQSAQPVNPNQPSAPGQQRGTTPGSTKPSTGMPTTPPASGVR
jgi:type II secretory pathway pseudopilin PulG